MSRVTTLLAATAVLACMTGCRPQAQNHATPDEDRLHAGDAGFVYEPVPGREAAPPAPPDAGARPAVQLFAGVPGGRGDLDGVGTDARIGIVAGMVRVGDAIVFADEGNSSIRKFFPATREVTTLARLPRLQPGVPPLPWGVAYDGKRDVYVADRSGQVIYALDLETRQLSVVVGQAGVRGDAEGVGAQALLDSPTGLAFGAGSLYVTDIGNRRIRRVDLATRAVSTLAAGFPQPWGLCFGGEALFLAENLDQAVLRLDPRTGASTVVAGSNSFGYDGARDGVGRKARFRQPRGLDCSAGALYLADRGNGQIRRIDATTGLVTALAGSSAGGLGYRDGQREYALFHDLQSTLVFGDTLFAGDDGVLRAVSLADGTVRTAAGGGTRLGYDVNSIERGEMLKPTGIAVSPEDGAAFVAGGGSWSVQRVDLTTGKTTTFAGSPQSGGFIDAWGVDARFGSVSGIAYDGRGNLFVGDPDNHAVRSVHVASRRVLTVAGTPSVCGNDDGPVALATFCDPSAMAFGAGALFVADASTQTIRRLDLAAGTVSTLAGTPFARGYADGVGAAARFSSPGGLAFADGALYVADHENDVVRRVDVATGGVTTIAGAPGQPGTADGPLAGARLDHPSAIAASGADGLLVIDRASVRRISLPGARIERLVVAGVGVHTGSAGPSLGRPAGIVELSPGDALVVDRLESSVLRLSY